jgi:TatA/E family protein of Tat protein translocase
MDFFIGEDYRVWIGMLELMAVSVIAFVICGPSRLPSLGKGIGEAIRGLK